ncbi:MAG: ABC transporter substrate-binding protein [Octadecabacter sp.]
MTSKMQFLMATTLASTVAFAAQAQDNSVTIVLGEELEFVEPCMSTKSNVGRVIFQNISETVTELDPSTGLQPRLAESWEDMGDGTWRFHLRQGVTFSDGSAMDAEDIAHTLERVVSPDIACEIGAKVFGGITVTSDIIDPYTIDVTADPAQPILPLLMSLVTVTPQDAPLDSFVDHPIGTGPYTFDEYQRGEYITLTANPNYWGDQPTVQTATYVFRSDSAVRAAMVAAGEADIAPNIAVQDATDPEMDFSYPNSETLYLNMEHAMAPLNDRRVREALNLAVDREAFIGTVLADGVLMATGITPPSTIGYNHDLTPYAYDPDRARELLAEARADGVPVDTEITLLGRNNNFGNVLETMEALHAMYQDVGFNMNLEMVEVAEWLERYAKPLPEGRGPTLIQAQHDNANGDPVFSMYFKYHTDGQTSGLAYPEIDAMIEEVTVMTGDERAAKWSDLFAYLHEDVIADVMLFHMVGFSRVNERLDFAPTIRTNSELQLSQIEFD